VVAQQGFQGNRRGLAGLALAAFLGGCAQSACLLPTETRMTRLELFFGRDVPGGGQVSEAEWADFAARTLTPEFPDGFTVADGQGQWRDPATQRTGREPTKIVLVAVPAGDATLARRLHIVVDTYRARFRQEAVGVVSTPVCGAF
jgi:hypothetical protein